MTHDGDVERVAAPVRTSRVLGHVRTLGQPRPPRMDPPPDDTPHLVLPAPPRWLTFTWLGAAIVLSIVLGDVRWGIGAAGLLVIAIVLRRVSQRMTFSFGEGFLPYRSDLGWPSGVQEDDDFHWSWTNGRRAT